MVMRAQHVTAASVALLVTTSDWAFRWVFAPLVLVGVLSLASLMEAWTEYRCCEHQRTFDFKKITREKLELTALCVGAMCLDTVMWVIARLAPEKFPYLSMVTIPFVTIVWTAWMIAAEVNRIRQNVKKSRGSEYSPPLVGGVFELVDRLKAADTQRAGHPHHPRRREADRIIAQVEQTKEVAHEDAGDGQRTEPAG